MRDLAQARKASLEARDNYRELCVTDRERYTPYLALAELNLARIYREERSYGFAIDCGLAARDRLRPIASRSAQLTSMLALTLRTLASIYRETGKVQVAEENCIEALSIFRTLRRQHHQFHSEYSAEIAITEGTWAGLLRRRGHLSDARKKCIHALERWQSLPAQLRARLVLDEVMLLYTVGDVETQLKQWKHATAHYRKAISICKKHCHRQTKVFEPYLAASLRNLGIILRDTSNEVEARSAFAEASRLFARHDLLLDNAVTCYEWGFLERYGRSSYKARVLFEKCVRNCEMELQKFQPEESDYHHLFKGRVENAYQWLIDYYADSIYKTSD
jgi:tetratricopeptide (TPR) repeat protein